MKTMQAIVQRQHEFFIEGGDETKLKPMILKDIATQVELDISTISRVANSKYVETDFGIIPLKFFFSEGLTNDDGEEVSNREIKKILSNAIGQEDKVKPLTDEALMDLLKEKQSLVPSATGIPLPIFWPNPNATSSYMSEISGGPVQRIAAYSIPD